jgi:hypothetical protein
METQMIDVFEIVGRKDSGFPYFDWRGIYDLSSPKQEPDQIVLQIGWTLFGFDFENAVAVFLDVGADCNLALTPFCFDEQVRRAKRLTVVTLDQFTSLAEQVDITHRLVQVYNMGHCGSTLLHNVFNKVPDVWCVSEPKVFFDLALWRYDLEQDVILKLSCAAFKFITRFPAAEKSKTLVIKHFSQPNSILPVLFKATPDAKNLFMYRDGTSWCNSIFGFVQRLIGMTMNVAHEKRAFQWLMMSGKAPLSELDGIIDMEAKMVTFDQLAAVAWWLHVRDYRLALNAGMRFYAFRFNELKLDRVDVIRNIFNYCGLQKELAVTTLGAFDTDSHEGTATAHDKEVETFNAENYRRIAEIFTNPRVNIDPDLRLPNS